jgi:hypothetical protein
MTFPPSKNPQTETALSLSPLRFVSPLPVTTVTFPSSPSVPNSVPIPCPKLHCHFLLSSSTSHKIHMSQTVLSQLSLPCPLRLSRTVSPFFVPNAVTSHQLYLSQTSPSQLSLSYLVHLSRIVSPTFVPNAVTFSHFCHPLPITKHYHPPLPSLPRIFSLHHSLLPIISFLSQLSLSVSRLLHAISSPSRPPNYLHVASLHSSQLSLSPAIKKSSLWYNEMIIGKNILLQQGEIGKVVHARI